MCRFPQTVLPVRYLDSAASAALAALLSLVLLGQTHIAIADDASAQVHGPNTIARQPIERATYLEPARRSITDSETPRPLPPAKRDSLSEKNDSPRAIGAIVSVVGSLTVVLGLFFLLTWLMRRGMPNSAARLPDDVVSVLGRAPLAGRRYVHVVRFGNKLLLLCASTNGFDKLAEITEQEEVQRIVGLCDRPQSRASTPAAGRIFGQIFTGGSQGTPAPQRSLLRIQTESARAEEAADA